MVTTATFFGAGTQVFPDSMVEVLQIDVPDEAGEVGDPARQGDVADIAAAVDEGSPRKVHSYCTLLSGRPTRHPTRNNVRSVLDPTALGKEREERVEDRDGGLVEPLDVRRRVRAGPGDHSRTPITIEIDRLDGRTTGEAGV